jgi:hypothetical protein
MTELRKLIESGATISARDEDIGLHWDQRAWLLAAANFSDLSAADKLRKVILPKDFIASSDSTGFAHVWQDEHETTRNWTALVPGNEGRARLLAILKAHEAIR